MLRNSSSGASLLLRDMLFDEAGTVRPARMSAVLNAALGHVAARTDGFVDLDAVPAEGAPLQVPAAACACLPSSMQFSSCPCRGAHAPELSCARS